MSNIQITELNNIALTEVKESELTHVVGGYTWRNKYGGNKYGGYGDVVTILKFDRSFNTQIAINTNIGINVLGKGYFNVDQGAGNGIS